MTQTDTVSTCAPALADAAPLEVFAISGSPPSWRVMLAMEWLRLPYEPHWLNASERAHKTQAFLALNPHGQVPVLRHGDVVVRESIAILAYLDRLADGRLFGATPADAASAWRNVMDFENRLRPHLQVVASVRFSGETEARAAELADAEAQAEDGLDALEATIATRRFIASPALSAADFVVFPGLQWLARALTRGPSGRLKRRLEAARAIPRWATEIELIEGYPNTYPPHWRPA